MANSYYYSNYKWCINYYEEVISRYNTVNEKIIWLFGQKPENPPCLAKPSNDSLVVRTLKTCTNAICFSTLFPCPNMEIYDYGSVSNS